MHITCISSSYFCGKCREDVEMNIVNAHVDQKRGKNVEVLDEIEMLKDQLLAKSQSFC